MQVSKEPIIRCMAMNDVSSTPSDSVLRSSWKQDLEMGSSLTSPDVICTSTPPSPRTLRPQPWVDCSYAQGKRIIVGVFRVVCVEI